MSSFLPDRFSQLFITFRSLTIDLRNARERLEAYKFIRRLFVLYSQRIPHSLVYVLNAIVSSSSTTSVSRTANATPIVKSDQMVKCCLELLCEIGKTRNLSSHFSFIQQFIFSLTKSTCFTRVSRNKYNVEIHYRSGPR